MLCTHTVISEGQYRCDWGFLCFVLCLQYWQETEEVCQDKHDECLHLTHLQTIKEESVVVGIPPVIWRSAGPPLLKLLFKPIMLKYWWFCLLKDYLCRFSPPIDTYTSIKQEHGKIFTATLRIQFQYAIWDKIGMSYMGLREDQPTFKKGKKPIFIFLNTWQNPIIRT